MMRTMRINKWKSLARNSKHRKRTGYSKKRCKSYKWADEIASCIMADKDIILGVGSFEEFVSGTILQKRYKLGKETRHEKVKVISSKREWNEFLRKYCPTLRVVQHKDNSGWAIDDSLDSYIDYYHSGDTFTIEFVGDQSFVTAAKDAVISQFQVVQSYIKWIHSTDGSYITMALNDDMLPIDGMYPFLGDEKLTDYYDRYLKSTAGILLLIGPPGTGKTTFIRGLLDHAKTSAIVTYDPAILEKDGLFADFLEDDECSIMVLEDSDAFLSARTDGNTMMHRFLNVSNGLVTAKGKKMIFSTNLPSVRDVDPALTRAGRCFDIAKFEVLQYNSAKALADTIGIELTQKADSSNTWTIAEIFHEQNVKPQQKFGFNQ